MFLSMPSDRLRRYIAAVQRWQDLLAAEREFILRALRTARSRRHSDVLGEGRPIAIGAATVIPRDVDAHLARVAAAMVPFDVALEMLELAAVPVAPPGPRRSDRGTTRPKAAP